MVIFISDILRLNRRLSGNLIDTLPEARRRLLSASATDGVMLEKAAGYYLLSLALNELYGVEPLPELSFSPNGKPYFSELPVFFSISHCNGTAAAAVSDRNIGIDIQDMRPYRRKIAEKVCNPQELCLLDALDESRQAKAFTAQWATKEALSKLTGEGFSDGFRKFDTTAATVFLSEYKGLIIAAAGEDGASPEIREI